jgi:hypothetical protein
VSNPYQPPGGFDAPPVKYTPYRYARTKVDYSEAFNFAMANPNWLVNCILLGIATVVPGFGTLLAQLVSLGYLYGDYDLLLRNGIPPPSDVKLEKFGDYLQRGLMPLVAAILLGMVVALPAMVLFMPIMFIGMGLLESTDGFSVIIVILAALGYFFTIIVLSFLVSPIMFRVGVTNRLEELFNYKWAMGMVKVVWLQMLVASIVIGFIGICIMLLGLLLCGVGTIPATGFVAYMNFHAQRQLYEIYITKGGEQIPLDAATK